MLSEKDVGVKSSKSRNQVTLENLVGEWEKVLLIKNKYMN